VPDFIHEPEQSADTSSMPTAAMAMSLSADRINHMKYECFINIYFLPYRKHIVYITNNAVITCFEGIFAPKRKDALGSWRKLYS
jgi:hypothetical protein